MERHRFFFFLVLLACMVGCVFTQGIAHERTLKAFEVESEEKGSTVRFLLDNDWVFTAWVPSLDKHKLNGLSRLVGLKASINSFPRMEGLVLTLENPTAFDSPKISFPGFLNQEVYAQLPTVAAIEISNYVVFSIGRITLSDGSVWKIVRNHPYCNLVETYWSVGDHVVASDSFSTIVGTSFLVNLDVSGTYWVDYYTNREGEVWFSCRDPRCVEVCVN